MVVARALHAPTASAPSHGATFDIGGPSAAPDATPAAASSAEARPGDDILFNSRPVNTKSGEASAMKKWFAFRDEAGQPHSLASGLSTTAAEDIFCLFLLWVFAKIQPRTPGTVAKPGSAHAVVMHVQRRFRDTIELPPMPRVQKLTSALERKLVEEHGAAALDVSRKPPMRLEVLLNARAKCAGLRIADRVVAWDEPFWLCIWACLMLLWYMGARKSDVLPTAGKPFSRGCTHRGFLSWHAPGTLDSRGPGPPTAAELAPTRGFLVRVRLGITKGDQLATQNAENVTVLEDDGDTSPANGAAALTAYALACPADTSKPLVDQPIFTVPGDVAITGELLDKILQAMLSHTLGAGSPRYSIHSMRIGAATALRAAGYSDAEICRAFRWASVPSMLLYAREGEVVRTDVTRVLAHRASPRASSSQVIATSAPAAPGAHAAALAVLDHADPPAARARRSAAGGQSGRRA